MKLNILIVDDEPLAREIIASYLRDFDKVQSISEVNNGIAAVNYINQHKPNLVFMDIEMPKLDGISVLDSERLTYQPLVVFTTAYNQFAIKAFELNAIDYLLKPFDRERFHDTMNKVLDKLKLVEMKDFHEQWFRTKIDYHNSIIQDASSPYPHKLVVRDSKRIKHILTKDIRFIKASGDYIEIHEGTGKFLLYKSISDIETKLDPSLFRRIHKSYIINCHQITEIRPHTNSEYHFHLSNEQVIKSGRTYKDKITDLIRGTI